MLCRPAGLDDVSADVLHHLGLAPTKTQFEVKAAAMTLGFGATSSPCRCPWPSPCPACGAQRFLLNRANAVDALGLPDAPGRPLFFTKSGGRATKPGIIVALQHFAGAVDLPHGMGPFALSSFTGHSLRSGGVVRMATAGILLATVPGPSHHISRPVESYYRGAVVGHGIAVPQLTASSTSKAPRPLPILAQQPHTTSWRTPAFHAMATGFTKRHAIVNHGDITAKCGYGFAAQGAAPAMSLPADLASIELCGTCFHSYKALISGGLVGKGTTSVVTHFVAHNATICFV